MEVNLSCIEENLFKSIKNNGCIYIKLVLKVKFIIFDNEIKIIRLRISNFILVLLVAGMSLCCNVKGIGQSVFGDRDKLLKAFRSSNSTEIRSYMGNFVNIHIAHESGVFTALQAATILDNFFKDHPPTTVTFVVEGESNLSYFCIAKYSSKGIVYRIYILFYNAESKYFIKQIDIEKE